jgi:hypothetical protein
MTGLLVLVLVILQVLALVLIPIPELVRVLEIIPVLAIVLVHHPVIVRGDLNHTNDGRTIDIKGAIASSRPGSLHLSMDQAWIRTAPS